MKSENKIYSEKSQYLKCMGMKKKNIRVLWRANTSQVKYEKWNIDSSHLTHMRYKERVLWSAEQNARARVINGKGDEHAHANWEIIANPPINRIAEKYTVI